MTDEQPVFVDGTGKRRKLFRVAGVVSGVVIAGYAVALGVSLGTGAEVPLTTWVVPEKKPVLEQEAEVLPKTAVPSAVPRPSVPVYVPPAVTPSATPTQTPTVTATPRPTVVTKTPSPTKKPTKTPKPTETASPTISTTPTVTADPSAGTSAGDQPSVPPGQEKKTVEE